MLMVSDTIKNLPEATVIGLPGYISPPWADAVADCTADIEGLSFLSKDSPQTKLVAV
jgi:hypothetical protein